MSEEHDEIFDDAVYRLAMEDNERLRARVAELKEMLQAARDHVKFDANSEGGIVSRIDFVLERMRP